MYDSSEMEILLWYQTSQNLAIGQEELLCWLWDKSNFYVGYGTRPTSILAMGQEQLLCYEEGSLETSHINFGELIGLHVLIDSSCLFLVTLET